MRTLVIIPAYNEEESIIGTIKDVVSSGFDVDYVVINDCSKDNTLSVLKSVDANYISLPVNLGIGGGMQAGYIYAYERGYDIAVQIDGDGQHDAAYLGKILEPLIRREADMVIGSRFIEKEGFQSSLTRRLGISFLRGLIKLLCGVKVMDVTSGMRAVNRRIIEQFALYYPQDYPEPEVILTCGMMGMNIKEVPVVMRERQGGVSSINAFRSMYYMIKVSISLVISRLTYSRRKRK